MTNRLLTTWLMVDSTNAVLIEWLGEVSTLLPKATETLQQVAVNAGTGQVTVKLCWQNGDGTAHELAVSNQVQWQP